MEEEGLTQQEMDWFTEQLTPGAPQYEKLLRLEFDEMPNWLLKSLGEDNPDGSMRPNAKSGIAGLMILIAKKGGLANDGVVKITAVEAEDAARRVTVNVAVEYINRAELGMTIELQGDPWSDVCVYKVTNEKEVFYEH
jgi:hypothetical protein